MLAQPANEGPTGSVGSGDNSGSVPQPGGKTSGGGGGIGNPLQGVQDALPGGLGNPLKGAGEGALDKVCRLMAPLFVLSSDMSVSACAQLILIGLAAARNHVCFWNGLMLWHIECWLHIAAPDTMWACALAVVLCIPKECHEGCT